MALVYVRSKRNTHKTVCCVLRKVQQQKAVLIIPSSLQHLLCRVISFEEGKALAESWNAAFLESSAKENQVRTPCAMFSLYRRENVTKSAPSDTVELVIMF